MFHNSAVVISILVALAAASAVCAAPANRELLSAPWTPFKPDGKLNLGQVRLDAEFEAKQGVTTIFAVGGMSQWWALTMAERKALAVEWIKQKHLGFYVIVNVGHQCVEESIELAKHAEMSGADAIAMLPPFAPQKPPTIDILVDIMVKIASSTKLPLFYYHFPGQTGVTFPFADILARALPRVPTLAGVKFVSDLGDFANVVQIAPPTFKLFWAPEPKIQAMPYGITRYVLAENYYAPYLAEVLDAYEAGNIPLAEQKQQRLNSLQNIINSVGGNRDVMKMLGIDMGPARLPAAPYISKKDYDSLQDALVKWGFFNNTRIF